MSVTMRRYMGRETPAEADIWDAVESAISFGVDPAWFIEIVREAWESVLIEKQRRDDKAWGSVKKDVIS